MVGMLGSWITKMLDGSAIGLIFEHLSISIKIYLSSRTANRSFHPLHLFIYLSGTIDHTYTTNHGNLSK